MDHQENKKKAKNWIQRFLKIKHRLRDRSSSSDTESEVYSRKDGFDTPSNPRVHRNSLRKSLKKMHTRVKSCIFSQEMSSPKRPVTVVGTPCTSSPPETPTIPPPEHSSTPDPFQQSPTRDNGTSNTRNHRIPTDEIISLSNCFWYWGPMATSEAEKRLQFKPDGTFLVRDSSSINYLFSISFRSVGKTMHARIEYSCGKYNLCGTYTEGFPTVTELIEDAMKTSENGIYCYSRKGEYECEFPVRLTKPISRYTEVRPLKHLCKFVIRQYTNMNDIPKLPLPLVLHEYLLEKPYF